MSSAHRGKHCLFHGEQFQGKVPDCVEDFLQVLSTHRIHMNLRFIYIEGGTQSFVSKKWFHLQKVSPVVKRSTLLPTNDSSLQLSHWNINSHLSLPVRQIFAAYLEFWHLHSIILKIWSTQVDYILFHMDNSESYMNQSNNVSVHITNMWSRCRPNIFVAGDRRQDREGWHCW